MYVSGIKCELCKTIHLAENGQNIRYDHPAGWWTLYGENPQTTTGWDFCSYACLLEWLQQRPIEEKKRV